MDDIQIIHGDARDVLPTLDLGEKFAIITDPPYGISHSSNYDASWANTRIAGDESSALRDWAIDWAKAHDAPWAIFGNWKCQRPHASRGVLVWDKGPASGMGDLTFPWKMSWEEIYVGGGNWVGRRDEGILRGHVMLTWESKGRKHPHQKPVSLMRDLICKLPPDYLIVDPFAGSGSTLVAAMKSGRRAIGIECDADHAATIRRRVEDARTPLFA